MPDTVVTTVEELEEKYPAILKTRSNDSRYSLAIRPLKSSFGGGDLQVDTHAYCFFLQPRTQQETNLFSSPEYQEYLQPDGSMCVGSAIGEDMIWMQHTEAMLTSINETFGTTFDEAEIKKAIEAHHSIHPAHWGKKSELAEGSAAYTPS